MDGKVPRTRSVPKGLMNLEVMEIGRESLIPEVQEPAGVAAFVEQAGRSQVTLFI